MDIHVAGSVDRARQVAGIMFAVGLRFVSLGGHMAAVPDRVGAAGDQTAVGRGKAHRFLKAAEIGVDSDILSDQDDVSGPVGGDSKPYARRVKYIGQAACEGNAQGIGQPVAVFLDGIGLLRFQHHYIFPPNGSADRHFQS